MIFTEILIENIFAYDGVSKIDLTQCDAERSIIVVTGPNGYGKTSLLNAIKLLFLGSADERLRRVGIGQSPLRPQLYVMGAPKRWYGVFNVQHRSVGSTARVALSWKEEGHTYTLQRQFQVKRAGAEFAETLSLLRDGKPLPNRDPQEQLQQLLPRELVPYFFFDGEQIQSLADADVGRESAEIERLLGLSFFGELVTQLKAYTKEKGREGLPEVVKVDIAKAEGVQGEAEAKAQAEGRARVVLEEEVAFLEQERDRVDEDRQRLRAGLSETERARLLNRIEILETQRLELAQEVNPVLPVEIPALANPLLVRKAFALLDEHLSAGADASVTARVHRELPGKIVEILQSLAPPVEIPRDQHSEFCQETGKALTELGLVSRGSNVSLFGSISPRQARDLRDRFLVWNQRGSSEAAAQAEFLRTLRRLTHEQAQTQRELDDAEITSDEAKARYAQLTEQWTALNEQITAKRDAMTVHRVEEDRAKRRAADAEKEVSELEAREADVVARDKAVQLGNKVIRALDAFRERRRHQIRHAVEIALNDKIAILLGPSQLIKRVELDDRFVMSYFDEMNEPVARHSISAGMRQLVATAMLWALKEQAERALPVMIDTPLGRIDRENRTLLVHEYYPKAGSPLILLPTNSEFGAEIYEQISNHICRSYRIENSGGLQAQIVRVADPVAKGR